MTLLRRRQGDDELLAQLRELLLPPSSSPTTTTPVVDHHQSCDGRRRRRPRGSKRGREDDSRHKSSSYNGEQHHDEEPEPRRRHSCKTIRKKQQQKKATSSLVTSVPDFDGYQWRKYGQKQIEGAMYARSYYRCTRSAEQGCPAKRTVQRNDDDGNVDGTPPKYTVVYMGEHTCTTNDSMEAPVILETTDVFVPVTSTSKRPQNHGDSVNISVAPTTSATTATGIIESPAISDDITWSSSGGSDDYVVNDSCGLFGVHDSWGPAPAAAASSLQEMEDFTGPIRSPVHVAAVGGWTFDHHFLMMQLASNEQTLFPISPFS